MTNTECVARQPLTSKPEKLNKTVYVVGSPHFPAEPDYDSMRTSGGMQCFYLKKALMRAIAACTPKLSIFLEQFCPGDKMTEALMTVFEDYKRSKDERVMTFLERQARGLFNAGWYNDAEHALLIHAAATFPDRISFMYNERLELIEAPMDERDTDIAANVLNNGSEHNLVIIGRAHALEALAHSSCAYYRMDILRKGCALGIMGGLPRKSMEYLVQELKRIKPEMESDPYASPADIIQDINYL